MNAGEFQRLADVEIDAVRPEPQGFVLSGQGRDRADYRLEVHFGLPLDARTRAVLAELLSQSEIAVLRRAPVSRGDTAHRIRRRPVTAD